MENQITAQTNITIDVVNGEPVVSSMVIAEHTDRRHKDIIGLIKVHKLSLEEFGRVLFQTAPFETNGGTQNITFCELNEQQSTFLMTLLSNKGIVIEFKKNLVKAFFMMKEKLSGQLTTHSQDLQPFMMEIVKSNQATTQALVEFNKNLEGLLKTIFNLANDFNRQKEDIREIKKYSEASHVNTHYARESIAKIDESTHNLIEAGYEMKVTAETILKKINRTTIDAEQQTLISNAVNKRANGLKDMYSLDLKYIKIIIWTKLSEKFNVNTYREIKTEDFYKAMQFLDYVDIKNQDLEIIEGR